MLQGDFKTFVLSIFVWPLQTGFTVLVKSMTIMPDILRHSFTSRMYQQTSAILHLHRFRLEPNKHELVTYIQVNIYIGNTLSWLNSSRAFKTDVCCRLNNHISLFICISLNFLQKAMVQYTIFKTVLLYLLKVYPSSWTSARNLGTRFSYF